MKDIARATGLSIKHVSRVVREEANVDPETRRLVQTVARNLQYRPNLNARSLVMRRSRAIGILAPELETPFFSELLVHLQAHLQGKQYFPYVLNTRWSPSELEDRIEALIGRGIDGLIAIGALPSRIERIVRSCNVPVVYAATGPLKRLPRNHLVAYDDEVGGQVAARHLLDLGHRSIACFTLAGNPENPRPRVEAFTRFLEDHDATPVVVDASPGFRNKDGFESSGELVEMVEKRKVSAVFCVCDSLAMGVMVRLHRAGIRIPEDVSVMGYDDLETAEFFVPALTTVAQPTAELGRDAAELVCRLAGTDSDGSVPNRKRARVQHIIHEPRLIVRESTASRAG